MAEDQEQIASAIRPLMAAAGVPPTKQVRPTQPPDAMPLTAAPDARLQDGAAHQLHP
jgi:hypothetical protein